MQRYYHKRIFLSIKERTIAYKSILFDLSTKEMYSFSKLKGGVK